MSKRGDNTDLEDEMSQATEPQIDERDEDGFDDRPPEEEWEELDEVSCQRDHATVCSPPCRSC